ncbi:hypothetical protein A5N81_34185 [Pseudomonas aeruginosa]|nr:hypothetical protein A5N81_34185 [Pseudomonas aeruginosa]
MVQSSHFFWRYPLALAAVLVLSACGKAPETTQGMAAPKVSVAEVIEQPLNEWDEFTGRLEAPESVELRPRVSGYIDRVAFHEGALVKKGDLLFQIDPRPFEAEVKRLERARDDLEQQVAFLHQGAFMEGHAVDLAR